MKRTVLAIGMLLQLAGCSQERAPATPPVNVSQEAHRTGVPLAAPARIDDSATPLPHGTTAREVTALLRKRIEAGDPQAACQLAREVEFCADAETTSQRMGMAAERIKAIEAEGAVVLNDVVQTMADLAKVRSEYCMGMPPVTPAETVNLWRQAALRGHLPSMLRYGTGRAFRHDRLLDTLDELKVYRRDGVEMTRRVAQSGNAEASLVLARAYAPRLTGPDLTPLLRQAVTPDAAQSLAYYLLAQHVLPTATSSRTTPLALQAEVRSLQLVMTPDELREGERRFDDLVLALKPLSGTDFDLMTEDERDLHQPIPGTGLCQRSGVAAAR